MEVALHKACRACKLDVIEYLMNKNKVTVTVKNSMNELPVHTLCTVSKMKKQFDSLEKITAIYSLLKAYPETILVCRWSKGRVTSSAIVLISSHLI
jgi:hypothetical protein